MSRRDAREKILQLLYQIESQDTSPSEQIDLFIAERTPLPGQTSEIDEEEGANVVTHLSRDEQDYVRDSVRFVWANREALDAFYSPFLKKWTVSRLPRIDRVLLRMCSAEIVSQEDVPASVAISECIRLCKLYAEEDSYQYINGVLGSISRLSSIEEAWADALAKQEKSREERRVSEEKSKETPSLTTETADESSESARGLTEAEKEELDFLERYTQLDDARSLEWYDEEEILEEKPKKSKRRENAYVKRIQFNYEEHASQLYNEEESDDEELKEPGEDV